MKYRSKLLILILDAVADHQGTGEQQDDLTLVVVKAG
jgi:hypothetical protein